MPFSAHSNGIPVVRRRLPISGVCALVLVCALGTAAPAQSSRRRSGEPRTIEGWVSSVKKAEERLGERWSVQVRDLESDEILFDYNGSQALVPASNRKIVTFGIALEKFGPEYEFTTQLGLTTPYVSGSERVAGDAILRSRGDPTFSPRYLAQKNPATILRGWIAAMRAMGVRRIEGDFIIDASAFGGDQDTYPEAWDASYRSHGYATPPSAIALNSNLLSIQADPNRGQKGRLKIYPTDEGLGIVNDTRVVGGRAMGLDAKFTEDGTLLVTGRIGRDASDHYAGVPLAQPLRFVKAIVADALKGEEIEVGGEVRIVTDPEEVRGREIAQTIGEHESAPLAEILKIMMRESDNFIGEQLWRAAAYRAKGRGDVASARDVEQEWNAAHGYPWIEPGYDGSGLSKKNVIAAAGLVEILRSIHRSPYGAYLIDSLPASGRSGTLRNRSMGESAGRIVAKTGTLSGVSALSGFIRDKRGRERWVFSAVGNAGEETNGRLTMRQDQIMKVLIELMDSGERPMSPAPARPSIKRPIPGTKEFVGKSS